MLALSPAIAIDDDAAVLFEDETISEAIAWREGASAYELQIHGDAVEEHALVPNMIGAIKPAFERDGDGKVVSLVHHQHGLDSHGIKLDSTPGNQP